MAFKDIDMSFNSVYSGIGTKSGDSAVIQLVNDAIKTHFGEELYDNDIGSMVPIYALGTRNIFTLNNIRDEVYFALISLKAISINRSNIVVTRDDVTKRFIIRIGFVVVDDQRSVITEIIFNYKK